MRPTESFLSPKVVQDEIASIVRGSTYGTVSYVEDLGHMVCLNFAMVLFT